MKTLVNSWFWALLLCATLGLAPWFPEPHIWGKLRWIEGGCIGMKPIDWWDFCVHAAPFCLLGRLAFLRGLSFFEKMSKMRYLNGLFAALLCFQFLGCADAQTASTKEPLAVFEKNLAASPTAQLVDVRTPAEFAAGHLKGAANIDFNGEGFEQKIGALDRGRDVFVYCAVGGRSGKAAAVLQKLGFKKIHDLSGGFDGWQAAGKPVEN